MRVLFTTVLMNQLYMLQIVSQKVRANVIYVHISFRLSPVENPYLSSDTLIQAVGVQITLMAAEQ